MKQLMLLTFLVLTFGLTIFAQPKTVTDYYLAFPADKYAKDIEGNDIKNKAALTKFRKSLIKIEDIKNGYLKLEGAWEGWAEIALFKKTDGSYIIGHVETGCGPACGGSINFYTYNAGKWTDVTKQVLPVVTEKMVIKAYNAKLPKGAEIVKESEGLPSYFVLPREGRTLKLECNECDLESSIMEFDWNGAKFVKK